MVVKETPRVTPSPEPEPNDAALTARREALRRMGLAAFAAPAVVAMLTSERVVAQTGELIEPDPSLEPKRY
jgi:hypothetical protein